MQATKHTRRIFSAAAILGLASVAGIVGNPSLEAQEKTLKVGIVVPLTGADAEQAILIKYAAMMAIDEANAKGGVAGYKIETMILDSGTATAGQLRSRTSRDQRQEARHRPHGRRQYRPRNERRRQGHGAHTE